MAAAPWSVDSDVLLLRAVQQGLGGVNVWKPNNSAIDWGNVLSRFTASLSSSSSSFDVATFTTEDLKNRWHNSVCVAYGPITQETGLVFSRLEDILLHSKAGTSASPEESSLKRLRVSNSPPTNVAFKLTPIQNSHLRVWQSALSKCDQLARIQAPSGQFLNPHALLLQLSATTPCQQYRGADILPIIQVLLAPQDSVVPSSSYTKSVVTESDSLMNPSELATLLNSRSLTFILPSSPSSVNWLLILIIPPAIFTMEPQAVIFHLATTEMEFVVLPTCITYLRRKRYSIIPASESSTPILVTAFLAFASRRLQSFDFSSIWPGAQSAASTLLYSILSQAGLHLQFIAPPMIEGGDPQRKCSFSSLIDAISIGAGVPVPLWLSSISRSTATASHDRCHWLAALRQVVNCEVLFVEPPNTLAMQSSGEAAVCVVLYESKARYIVVLCVHRDELQQQLTISSPWICEVTLQKRCHSFTPLPLRLPLISVTKNVTTEVSFRVQSSFLRDLLGDEGGRATGESSNEQEFFDAQLSISPPSSSSNNHQLAEQTRDRDSNGVIEEERRLSSTLVSYGLARIPTPPGGACLYHALQSALPSSTHDLSQLIEHALNVGRERRFEGCDFITEEQRQQFMRLSPQDMLAFNPFDAPGVHVRAPPQDVERLWGVIYILVAVAIQRDVLLLSSDGCCALLFSHQGSGVERFDSFAAIRDHLQSANSMMNVLLLYARNKSVLHVDGLNRVVFQQQTSTPSSPLAGHPLSPPPSVPYSSQPPQPALILAVLAQAELDVLSRKQLPGDHSCCSVFHEKHFRAQLLNLSYDDKERILRVQSDLLYYCCSNKATCPLAISASERECHYELHCNKHRRRCTICSNCASWEQALHGCDLCGSFFHLSCAGYDDFVDVPYCARLMCLSCLKALCLTHKLASESVARKRHIWERYGVFAELSAAGLQLVPVPCNGVCFLTALHMLCARVRQPAEEGVVVSWFFENLYGPLMDTAKAIEPATKRLPVIEHLKVLPNRPVSEWLSSEKCDKSKFGGLCELMPLLLERNGLLPSRYYRLAYNEELGSGSWFDASNVMACTRDAQGHIIAPVTPQGLHSACCVLHSLSPLEHFSVLIPSAFFCV